MTSKAEKIVRKIRDIETLTSLCVRKDSAKSVTATLKYALFISSRELFFLVNEMYTTLEGTIIDEYNLDYETQYKIICHCINDLENALHLNGDGDVNELRDIYRNTAKEIEAKEEKQGYDFKIYETFDSEGTNHCLLYNQYDVENNAYGTLQQIGSRLKSILQEHEAFAYDLEIDTEGSFCFIPIIRNRFQNVLENYRTSVLWLNAKDEIKAKVSIDLRNTCHTQEDYKDWLLKYQYEASGLARLYKQEGEDALKTIYERREKYSQADLTDLCQYIETCRLLEKRIGNFDWTTEPSGAYSNLFVNKGCETLMQKLAPTLNNIVDVKSVYEYSALLFVMMDLGIAHKGRNNVTEFIAYLKRYFGEDFVPSSINKKKRLLINDSFGSMTDESIEERFDSVVGPNLKEHYMAYFTIVNSLLQKNVNEIGLQGYLDFDHLKTAEQLEANPIEVDNVIENIISAILGKDMDF